MEEVSAELQISTDLPKSLPIILLGGSVVSITIGRVSQEGSCPIQKSDPSVLVPHKCKGKINYLIREKTTQQA